MKIQFNSIRFKTTLILCASFFLSFALLIAIGYRQGFSLLKTTIANENIAKSYLVASAVSRIISEEIDDEQFYLKDDVIREGIKQHYDTIKGIPAESLKEKYLDLDSQWADKPQEDPLLQTYLATPLSLKLQDIVALDSGVDEILIADRFGGLIGASEKTSDYYQADERWWIDGYDNGKGAVFMNNTEFDDSAHAVGFPMILPITNAGGEVIAVCKVLLNVDRVFSPLSRREVTEAGRFALLDEKGNVHFHQENTPLRTNINDKDFLRQLNSRDNGWFIGYSPLHPTKRFYAFSKVNNSYIDDRDFQWFAIYDSSIKDVFGPLDSLIEQLIFVSFLAIIFIVIFGLWLGNRISRPILELECAARKFGEGDLSYRAAVIGSNNEIQMVVDALNAMAENLQKNMTSADYLRQEILRREEAEAVLKENESNLMNVVQNNIYGVVVVDTDGNGLFVNGAAEKILGKGNDQLIGQHIGLPLVPGDKADVQVFNDAGQRVCEMRAVQTQWKKSRAVLIILRDITEEKQYESKIHASVERYKSFISVTGQVAWITDVNGQVNQDLPEWRRFTGQSAEDILGSGWAKAVHPDDATVALQVWREAVEEKRPYETEYRLRRHDGIYRSMLARGVPVLDKAGEIREWIGVCIDITERKQLEEDLRIQEQLLRNIINTIPAYVFWKDINFVYLGCNQNFTRATGLSDPEEIQGKTDYDLPWTKEEADHYREDDRKVMDSNQPKLNIEETQLQNDGVRRSILTNKVPLKDKNGRVFGVLGTFMDISKMKELEAQMLESHAQLELMVRQLEQSNQKLKETQAQFLQAEKMAAIGQLSAGVAHEVKNPLAVVLLAIDCLEKCIVNDDEKIKRYSRMIREAAERANKVIMDLMNFSRYSDFELQEIKVLATLQSTIGLIENTARIKGVEIIKDFQCPDDTTIPGDAQLLEQVFLNIFGNALDAITDERGKISVKVCVSEDELKAEQHVLKIEIADTGGGMPEEIMKNIFNPFFTTKEQGKGTGLGLSTVFMIIKNHKGTIQVSSQESKGTTFIITLPLQNRQV